MSPLNPEANISPKAILQRQDTANSHPISELSVMWKIKKMKQYHILKLLRNGILKKNKKK